MSETSLTICYLTVRKEPRLQWFLASLNRERMGFPPDGRPEVRVIVIDHYAPKDRSLDEGTRGFARVRPKPNVWNGEFRLTKEDWFNAGSARNTGICYCRTPWIAFVDDLSVLRPGWLAAAIEATNYPTQITLGAYRKLKKLVVDEAGNVASYEEFPAGIDNRQKHVDPSLTQARAFPAYGSWLYGCSLVAPVEAFLQINGWEETVVGGIGFEDVTTGMILTEAGWKFRYDTRLMTFESEEDHHVEPPFKKSDYGVSPNDKSHKVLELLKGVKRCDNPFDLRALRDDILSGKPFPIPTTPTHEWYTGIALKDL